MAYDGLPDAVRKAVDQRDGATSPTGVRCRWCGATNEGRDIHHIVYRKGPADDVVSNLVSLCRTHHSFVHGNLLPSRAFIGKADAQEVLLYVIDHPGVTGASYWRTLQRRRQQEAPPSA